LLSKVLCSSSIASVSFAGRWVGLFMLALLMRTSIYLISCSILEIAAETEVGELASHSIGIMEPLRLLAASMRAARRRPRR
jgi:hypothetical protein